MYRWKIIHFWTLYTVPSTWYSYRTQVKKVEIDGADKHADRILEEKIQNLFP